MRKTLFFIMSIILFLNINLVLAHEHNFAETKQLIDSGISCNELTEEQLEAIGDYYMEQMHPGEAHEVMDAMMGGEGSASLRQVHINMARRLYCNDDLYIGYGMMGSGGMMGGMMGSGGMMSMFGGRQLTPASMTPGGGFFGYWNINSILYLALLIGLIILVYFWVIKLWRDSCGRKK